MENNIPMVSVKIKNDKQDGMYRERSRRYLKKNIGLSSTPHTFLIRFLDIESVQDKHTRPVEIRT